MANGIIRLETDSSPKKAYPEVLYGALVLRTWRLITDAGRLAESGFG